MNQENLNWKVDRTGWESGEWDTEPDRVDFKHAGFACFLLRNTGGAWCGYVGVPKGHPSYEQDYNEVGVDVHGGLTYGAKCDGHHICHVPAPGEPDDLFWLGFDCNHCWDRAPGFRARERALGMPMLRDDRQSEYRTMAYARGEVERLADQLAEYSGETVRR